MPHTLRSRIALSAAVLVSLALVCLALAIYILVSHEAGEVLLAIVVFIAIVLPIAAAIVLWRLRRPLEAMESVTRGLRQLESGDLSHRVTASEPGESHNLAQAFNRTAETVREIIDDLRGERNKLSAVLETMADGVLVVDEKDEVTLMNRAARALLVPPAPLSGTSGAPAVTGNRLRDHELQQMVRTCRSTGDRQHGEVRLLAGRRMLSAIATPLHEGEGVHVLLTLHDLTPRRLVETTRREFVTNVSHELRSPLASVKAMVETLESGALEDPERAKDFLARIHRETDRMHSMVNDLLELARLESGQAELERAPLDLAALADEVAVSMYERAEVKGVTLAVEREEGVPAAFGDAGKLRQVIINLVDNAVKFTPPGRSVTVRVSHAAEQSMVRLEVSDTGAGIAPEHVPHVFERFYKVDRSRRDGGTGLGLAIANHIVQAHGGSISVESVEGEGSRFAFTIPTGQ